MLKTLSFRDRDVFYKSEGDGETLLFVHGYLESSDIWEPFTGYFKEHYRVITVDIPGHGKSGVIGSIHRMSEMAEALRSVLEAENVNKAIVIGHSMGGYITMEFVHRFPGYVKGYVLFHSTCFADSEEKKLNREREISLVLCGKKMQIIRTNIPKGFADENQSVLKEQIARAGDIALCSTDEGVVALLRGMMEREDHSAVLGRALPPSLLIWGRKDNYIGEAVFEKLLASAPGSQVVILENSGHMGFIEEPEAAAAGILDFLARVG